MGESKKVTPPKKANSTAKKVPKLKKELSDDCLLAKRLLEQISKPRKPTFKEALSKFFETAFGLLFLCLIVIGVTVVISVFIAFLAEIITNTESLLALILGIVLIKLVWNRF